MKRRLAFFSNLSIRYKLFASYLLVLTIPFLILLFMHIHATQKENKASAVYAAHKVLDETKDYLQYKSEAITEVLNFIAFNNLVQDGVSNDSAQYEDINLWHMDALQLSRLVNQFRYNEDINSIQLYMKSGLAGATENPDFLNMGRIEATEWFKAFTTSNTAFAWLPSNVLDEDAADQEISVLRKIPNAHNIQQFDGIVRARVKKSAMQSVLDHANLTPSTSSILLNERGEMLSASSSFPFNDEQVQTLFASMKDTDSGSVWNETYVMNGNRYLVGIQEIAHTNMKMAMVVPYSDILQSSTKARNRIISLYLMIVPFMLPLSFLVASNATRRILRLITHLRKIRNGHFQMAPLPTNEDEIGELTRNFNRMVENISGLMDETYKLGREVKDRELKALQAQINPHFLYNTLDLINIMAIESGTPGISRVVDELAVFYRLSLSNGKEIVSLESEMKHVEAYVRIQNMRFGEGIRLQFEVPRELYDIQMPKILLQPLVENAILHGIMEKDPEEGTIRISAWIERNDLVIQVSDDGVGMDESELNAIRSGGIAKDSGGYGIRNIAERLQLKFGPAYGLKFESQPGEGTVVQMRLPDRRNREDQD